MKQTYNPNATYNQEAEIELPDTSEIYCEDCRGQLGHFRDEVAREYVTVCKDCGLTTTQKI